LKSGGWRLEVGGWRLEAGGGRLEAEGWRRKVVPYSPDRPRSPGIAAHSSPHAAARVRMVSDGSVP